MVGEEKSCVFLVEGITICNAETLKKLESTDFVKIDEKLTKINNTYNPSQWKGGKNICQFGNFAVTLAST